MAKTRTPSNPLSAILRAGRKPVVVSATLPDGSEHSFTLRMPPAKARAALLDTVADAPDEGAGTMLGLAEGAVKASLDGAEDQSEEDISDLVAMTGGIQGELALTALRLCGFGRAPGGKQSPLPTGSQGRSPER